MRTILLACSAAMVLSCNSSKNTAMTSTENGGDWMDLFDGKSTAGWHTYGKTGVGTAWKVNDGVLYLDGASKKSQGATGGDIVTDQEFDNFHLKYDWKIAPKGNSGVVFFIKEDPQFKSMWNTGPEMQVLDNGTTETPGHPDAKIVSHRAGDLYDLVVSKEVVKPVGEWNTAEIVSNKGKLEFYLNGQQTLSTTMWDENWNAMVAKSKFKSMAGFGSYNKGRIGLQDHGDDVWFRNIKIRKL